MFDTATLREELEAIERKLEKGQKIDVRYAVHCYRGLRQREQREYDDTRNSVTGY